MHIFDIVNILEEINIYFYDVFFLFFIISFIMREPREQDL